ncbi:MAG: 3-phosphoshikimate 1-carboxyvinyltransferase [Thermoguttaceae bacterium]
MSKIQVKYNNGPVNFKISPPGSKSITNRALIIAALADGKSELTGVLDSEDTQIMYDVISALGLETEQDKSGCKVCLTGQGGVFPNHDVELYVGNSGTTARFITAALALAQGDKKYRIYGKDRMHQRPIRHLTDALKVLGANIRCENRDGCPPVLIGNSEHGQTDWNTPGSEGRPITAAVAGDISSQFLSALMMSAPLVSAKNDVVLRITGNLVSRPYIDMTAKVMESFGVETHFFFPDDEALETGGTITIPLGSAYKPCKYHIEPDASAASYFFAVAAICGGEAEILGFSPNLSEHVESDLARFGSLQGDIKFVNCLERMGCKVVLKPGSISVIRDPETVLRGIDVDMNDISDTVQTLSVVALFCDGPTRIRNVAHIRHKETDRISAVVTELCKIGAVVEEFPDGLEIHPPKERKNVEIETYDDHRMAMSFALAGLRDPGITILNPECTQKTFPDFFEELFKVL